MHIAPNVPEIERGIEWKPDLVLFDVRSFDLANGWSFIEHFCRAGLQVCVIDAADDDVRRAAWLRVGPLEVIDGREPFEHLFLTITRLLRVGLPPRADQRSPASLTSGAADRPGQDPRSQILATLSDREFDHLFQTITRLLRVGLQPQAGQGGSVSVASAPARPAMARPPATTFRSTDQSRKGRPGGVDGRPLRGGDCKGCVLVDLDYSLTNQVDSPETWGQFAAGGRCIGTPRRMVPRPRGTPRPKPANARRSRAS